MISCNYTSNSKNDDSSHGILKNEIIGSWGNPEDSVPVFKIDKDSILYVQSNKAYLYKLINNDIVVDHPGDQWILKNVSIIEDTMFFYDRAGIQLGKALKFKNHNSQ